MERITLTVALLVLVVTSPGQTPNSAPKVVKPAQPAADLAAWQAACKIGTPAAFKEFYQHYPHSPRIKVVVGTLRGRYWYFVDDPARQSGVLVTAEGYPVLLNLSLSAAVDLGVITSTPIQAGTKFAAKGMTFHWNYVEIDEGGIPQLSTDENVKQLIEPKDSLMSSIVLTADGRRLLAWDLSNAEAAKKPSSERTFIEVADPVAQPLGPASNGPWVLDKKATPESQPVTVEGTLR